MAASPLSVVLKKGGRPNLDCVCFVHQGSKVGV